jgi:hypothetical protein
MKKIFIPFVCFIFIWGIALRAVEIVNGNYLFGFDQGRDYLAAYNIVENHKLTLIGSEIGAGSAGLNGIFHGPGYYYLLACMYILSHGDPYGGLLLMFGFGVATLIVVYATTKRIFGKTVGIISLFLVGISPLIVSQSRFLWNHHPSSFFIALTLYFVYMISAKPRLYAPLALLTGGLIYHFELAIAVPVVAALWLSLPLIFRIKDVKTYLYSSVSTTLAFLPFVAFDSRHGWPAIRTLSGYLFGGSGSTAGISWTRISDHLRAYLYNASNSFMFEFIGGPLSKVLSACLFIALILMVFRTKDMRQRLFFRFLLVLLIVSYGILLFLNNSVWDYYLIHAHFVYIYIFAYLVILLFSKLRKNLFARIGFYLLSAFILLMIWSSAKRMYINIMYDLVDLGGVEKIKGKRQAVDYIFHDADGKPFSEFTFMAPIYTYPYEYLFKTYGLKKYGYVPGTDKKGLVYLIIEPDNSKPWTYKGWLETVIVGGDIISTTTLPTGHIVQKRLFSP